MYVKTEDSKVQTLEKLLNEARSEADDLRKKIKRCEDIIVSTRLIMGHELKKPATAISGYLDLVSEELYENDNPEALTFVEKALEECALLNDLNEYFIELLNVGKDGEVVGREPVNVRELVREVIAYARRIDDTKRAITHDFDLPEAPVDVDGTALKLVLMNLVENALNYSQVDSPVRIEVEKGYDRRGCSEDPLLKVRVADEGIGIPMKFLSRVFDPFVRLQRDAAPGSGLGLTLVRSLVELNGGEVSIQSRQGQGTTVYVTLPMGSSKAKEPAIHL
jgi:signal transduction histidine kinase